MAIGIRNKALDRKLDRLVQRQKIKTCRAHLAESMILAAIARCESMKNPMAWMFPEPSNGAQGESVPAAVNPGNQTPTPASPGLDMAAVSAAESSSNGRANG